MKSLLQKNRSRAGITITEALASIAVAAVGLFAVIAVIPFAARQTEAGLDLDVSVSVGKNAFHDFDVRGMGRGNKWRLANINLPDPPGNPTANYAPNGAYWLGKAFVIDPLFLTKNDPIANPQISVFPYTLYNGCEINANRIPPTAPVQVGQSIFGIDRINISVLGRPYNFAQAESVFRSVNELLYEDPADNLLPPNQQFKRDGAVDLKRSYAGKISWMAMMVPEASPNSPNTANPQMYRLYVIVFRDRQLNFRAANPKGEVVLNGVMQFDPSVGVSPNGGSVDLKLVAEADLPVPGTNNEFIQDDYLQSGDWILLTDYAQLQADGTSIDSNGTNWRWYQIQRVEPSDQTTQLAELTSPLPTENARVTLVGPDWTGRDIDLTTPNVWDVRAIAMSNVVAVYEKTIRIEYGSIWNE